MYYQFTLVNTQFKRLSVTDYVFLVEVNLLYIALDEINSNRNEYEVEDPASGF